MKDVEQRKSISVQAKISPISHAKLEEIAIEYGFKSVYEIVQWLISAFLSYVGGESQIESKADENMKEYAKIFEGYQNNKNRIITTKPGGNRQLKLVETIFVFSEVGKRGYVCKRISINGDKETITDNPANAIRSFIRKLFPKISGYIESVGNEIGETNYMRILEYILSEETNDDIHKTVSVDFEALKQKTEYGRVPVRARNKTINKYE